METSRERGRSSGNGAFSLSFPVHFPSNISQRGSIRMNQEALASLILKIANNF
jgi:hypothetical protein